MAVTTPIMPWLADISVKYVLARVLHVFYTDMGNQNPIIFTFIRSIKLANKRRYQNLIMEYQRVPKYIITWLERNVNLKF